MLDAHSAGACAFIATCPGRPMRLSMDDREAAILSHLRKARGPTPLSMLAAAIGYPATSCWRSLLRMADAGSVRLAHVPRPEGGCPRLFATASGGPA